MTRARRQRVSVSRQSIIEPTLSSSRRNRACESRAISLHDRVFGARRAGELSLLLLLLLLSALALGLLAAAAESLTEAEAEAEAAEEVERGHALDGRNEPNSSTLSASLSSTINVGSAFLHAPITKRT